MFNSVKTILAIESSCDETACAIVQKADNELFARVAAETTATSLTKHIETQGIVPEVAAREQVKAIFPVVDTTLQKFSQQQNNTTSHLSKKRREQLIQHIDAIAVTTGPGLIGSLLVGVEAARTLSLAWKKPIIPVDHVLAHQYGNFVLDQKLKSKNQDFSKSRTTTQQPNNPTTLQFPALSWVISGGHTDLFLMKSHQNIVRIGEKIDDSAGECFDKCARVLGYNYPGGPNIERLAKQSNNLSLTTYHSKLFALPRPLLHSKDFNTSFSGLKTAFARKYKKLQENQQFLEKEISPLLAAELQQAIVDIISKKTQRAIEQFPEVKTVLLSGGVAANKTLSDQLQQLATNSNLFFHSPPLRWCTDNATMIGAYALFHAEMATDWREIEVRI